MNDNQHLSLSLEKVQSLKTLLEDEFSALKAKDLGRFESYQASKADILSFLAQQDLMYRVSLVYFETLMARDEIDLLNAQKKSIK